MKDVEESVFRVLALAKLVGQAPAFTQAIRQLPQIARSDAAVLLRGETGTGKELTARALHYLSPRAGGPFVALNCGTLSETLLESELFGHVPGAFTDARAARPGLLAHADGGTLFLDEVDRLSRHAQVALLRVLQEHRYRPVGADAEQSADVRLISASNAPLETLMSDQVFPPDLYFRLCVFTVHLPPLRERREDIRLLAEYFLNQHALADRSVPKLSDDGHAALLAYHWPGNVRELENAIRRSISFCDGHIIKAEDFALPGVPETVSQLAPPPEILTSFQVAKRQTLARFERDYLSRLMTACAGNLCQAARLSGQERRNLSKLLHKYGLDARSFRLTSPTT